MFLRNITIFLENISIFFGNIKVFLQQESVSKLNRPIPSSAVGAGVACPKTQSKLFSGERTSRLPTKRQHYPHFDTSPCLKSVYVRIGLHIRWHKPTRIYVSSYTYVRMNLYVYMSLCQDTIRKY